MVLANGNVRHVSSRRRGELPWLHAHAPCRASGFFVGAYSAAAGSAGSHEEAKGPEAFTATAVEGRRVELAVAGGLQVGADPSGDQFVSRR